MTAPLTDEVLADLLARVERFQANADESRRVNGAGPLSMRIDPATVAALVREVQRLRKAIVAKEAWLKEYEAQQQQLLEAQETAKRGKS